MRYSHQPYTNHTHISALLQCLFQDTHHINLFKNYQTVRLSNLHKLVNSHYQLTSDLRYGVDFMCFPLNCISQSQPYNAIRTTLYMSPCLFLRFNIS
nr:MAG TPA: hypothetical protein [Bacteriophage sp.]